MNTPSREQDVAPAKTTLYHLHSIYWHVNAGTTSLPAKFAVKYQIPLIIWGSHEATEQVSMYKHTDEVEMSRSYRHNHHLMGLEIDDLKKLDPSLKRFNNSVYQYPSYSDLQNDGVRGIHLSNYIPWNQKTQQEQLSEHYKYLGCRTDTKFIYYAYEYTHCAFYNGIHDWIKCMKYDYNRTLDHLARDLRWGRLNKSEAIQFLALNHYQKPNKYIRIFREFMGMQKNSHDCLSESMKNVLHFDQVSSNSKLYLSIKDLNGVSDSKMTSPQSLYSKIRMSSITNQKPYTLLTGSP